MKERLNHAIEWCEKRKLNPKPLRFWKANNKEHIKKYTKEWNKNNPEKYKANLQRGKTKRRVKFREIINTLTAEEWIDILEAYNYRCAYCDVEFEVENMPTKDHIIPLIKGGNNTKENIVPACRSCNSSKKDKISYVK